MTTYTAGQQIERSLRLLGVLAEGETPSAATSQDALMALNQMIDSWNTERLSHLLPKIKFTHGLLAKLVAHLAQLVTL